MRIHGSCGLNPIQRVVTKPVVIFAFLITQAFWADAADNPHSLMKELAGQGWHDLNREGWNAYAQATYISSWKPAFPAALPT